MYILCDLHPIQVSASHRNLLHFTALTTAADLYKSQNSSLCRSILATYPAQRNLPHFVLT